MFATILAVGLLLFSSLAFCAAPCPAIDAEFPEPTYKKDTHVQLVITPSTGQTTLSIRERRDNTYVDHPVTFSTDKNDFKSEDCPLMPISLIRGGGWGWHVLWQTDKGLFYARVDGEAWVSSVPKKLTASAASAIKMHVQEQHIIVRWRESQNGNFVDKQVASLDEGRSWD